MNFDGLSPYTLAFEKSKPSYTVIEHLAKDRLWTQDGYNTILTDNKLKYDFSRCASVLEKDSISIADIKMVINGEKSHIIPDYEQEVLSIDKIMSTLGGINPRLVDTTWLEEADTFEVDNPTDYSRMNFLTSRISESKMSDNVLRRIYDRCVDPVRYNEHEADVIEYLSRPARIRKFKEKYDRYPNDSEIITDIMWQLSYLSPLYYATFFFYPDGYQESGYTLSNNSILPEEKRYTIRGAQKAFLLSNNNQVALLTGRQFGKSTSEHWDIPYIITTRQGAQGFYIAKTLDSTSKFMQEIYDGKGGSKLHPYIYEVAGEMSVHGQEKSLVYRKRDVITGKLSGRISRCYVAYASEVGSARFIGTKNQFIWYDEIGTFSYDPTGDARPSTTTYAHYYSIKYASTIKEGENPYNLILRGTELKKIQRNILFSAYVKEKTDHMTVDQYILLKREYINRPEEWKTEYLAQIPESSNSLLSLIDIYDCCKTIDIKLNAHYDDYLLSNPEAIEINGILLEDTYSDKGYLDKYNFRKKWGFRDKNVFQIYNLKTFGIGVDCNGSNRGNNIDVIAVCETKTEPKEIVYIHYDSYIISGQQSHYNSIILIYYLMDTYKVPMTCLDEGWNETFKAFIRKDPELYRTPGGIEIYNPNIPSSSKVTKDGKPVMGEFTGFKFIHMGRKTDVITKDIDGNDEKTKVSRVSALKSMLVTMIKQNIFLESVYESTTYQLVSEVVEQTFDSIDIDGVLDQTYKTTSRTDKTPLEYKTTGVVEDSVKFVDDVNEVVLSGTSSMKLELISPNVVLTFDMLNAVNSYTRLFTTSPYNKTCIDELRNMTVDSSGKYSYVLKTPKIQDDNTISVSLGIYLHADKYTPMFSPIQRIKQKESAFAGLEEYLSRNNSAVNDDGVEIDNGWMGGTF